MLVAPPVGVGPSVTEGSVQFNCQRRCDGTGSFCWGVPGNPQRTADKYVKKTCTTWATPSRRQLHSDAVTIKRVTARAFIGTKRYSPLHSLTFTGNSPVVITKRRSGAARRAVLQLQNGERASRLGELEDRHAEDYAR